MIVTPGRLFFLYVLLSKRFTHTDSNLIMIVIPGRPSFLYVLLSERFTHTDGDLVIHFDLGQTQTETAYKFSGLRVSRTSTLLTRLYTGS